MNNKYSVGFLIPKGAIRILSDDGWEFKSKSKLDASIENYIENYFTPTKVTDEYSIYESDRFKIKIDINKDQSGQIENVYCRFYNGLPLDFLRMLRKDILSDKVEFFVPSQG